MWSKKRLSLNSLLGSVAEFCFRRLDFRGFGLQVSVVLTFFQPSRFLLGVVLANVSPQRTKRPTPVQLSQASVNECVFFCKCA